MVIKKKIESRCKKIKITSWLKKKNYKEKELPHIKWTQHM